MTQILGLAIGIVVIACLLALLYGIIRFSIISPRITRGAGERLRKPDPAGIEALCGFTVPSELVELYRTSPFIDMTEFSLEDPAKAEWSIAGFEPLTLIDVKEWRKITGVPGIPIATDYTKGAYYVNAAGAVRLQSPNVTGGDIEVAPSIAAFFLFRLRPEAEGD